MVFCIISWKHSITKYHTSCMQKKVNHLPWFLFSIACIIYSQLNIFITAWYCLTCFFFIHLFIRSWNRANGWMPVFQAVVCERKPDSKKLFYSKFAVTLYFWTNLVTKQGWEVSGHHHFWLLLEEDPESHFVRCLPWLPLVLTITTSLCIF